MNVSDAACMGSRVLGMSTTIKAITNATDMKLSRFWISRLFLFQYD